MADKGAAGKKPNRMELMQKMRGDLPAEVVRQGFTLPWMVSDRSVEALKDYDIRDDDVWVTTYPKAGTHWAVEIANLVLADGNMENIDRKKQPHPIEFDFGQPGTLRDPGIPEHMLIPKYETCRDWPSPRVFMTHLPEALMPRQICEGGKGKAIFVIRNPKDLAVSMWHFLRPGRDNPAYEKWDTFFDLYCTEDCPYGSWFTYNLEFWTKHRGAKNFLFLKYEDMKQDTRGAVVQIADFLGRPLSDEAIDRITKAVSLDSMKQRFNTAGGDPSKEPKIGAPGIIRKGIVGDWKTQFTVAQNDKFDKLFRERMEGSDLHVDFEIKKYFSTATVITT